MKDEELPSTTVTTTTKKDSADAVFGKGRYKFWVLGAIVLLAFWSMFASTVSLKWSAGNLNQLTDDIDAHLRDDLDVLEIEEREKVVKQMWEVYTRSHRIRLPRFWQEAFEAAYEQLESDVPGVRGGAISEIAKMSMHTVDLEPQQRQQANTKQKGEEGKSVSSAEQQ
ncbi:hypothetical protein H6P81_000820 [Aristolochia fimbriata]|uniref:Uncharacterized protein n=1 Tax=Aristolochia fimbriata TaxID=158543 RepID=A0AAV7F8I3_ARIFI|nr:hypothetical protein H6P81_000820 [Aristolochia fimbriata]